MGYGIDRGFGYAGSPHPATVCDVAEEVLAARGKFAKFNSPHEGYAVLLEEVDELWAVVKAHKGGVKANAKDRIAMRKEAVQVAAMALRFIEDVCDR